MIQQHAMASPPSSLQYGFAHPPASCRPWVYWFWLNGNITREGITADLQAMKRVGIGGVLIMEVDQGIPRGPVDFMSPQWRSLFKFVVSEAQRLGLQINMNDDAGWNGSGGPWIKPEQAMQKLVWSETEVDTAAGETLNLDLKQPETIAGYYRDIRTFAVPTGTSYRIPDMTNKALFTRAYIAPDAKTESVPADQCTPINRVIDLTRSLQPSGQLRWASPGGKWTIIRMGHTCTGAVNAPAPQSGTGLECDKLSKAGAEANFAGMIARLADDNPNGLGTAFVSTHIDSWENGMQNWTSEMRAEFISRRGYDPLPYLPVVTGRVIGNPQVSERFLWDLRQTISDLTVQNYAGRTRQLANSRHLRLSIEAYNGCCDDMTYGGMADEPMGEFWIGGSALETLKEMSSTSHIYGHPITGAETFTADDHERWQQYPGSVKALGDRGFCDGINRFVFHRYAMQPWTTVNPGMTMGPWGVHWERTNTWWDWSKPWNEYVARCQYLIRQGRFCADICYLQPEMAPQGYAGHTRRGYDFDNCTADVVLNRMSVKNGKIFLPDGMNYKVLVLPDVKTMTPSLLRKIASLIECGAKVLGQRPERAPGLQGYPRCDAEVQELADRIWGNCDGVRVKARTYGKGKVFAGITPEEALKHEGILPDCSGGPQANWIHRSCDDAEIYFVANSSSMATESTCSFRVKGLAPEFWDPETGTIRSAPVWTQRGDLTYLPIRLEQSGSVFVVFRSHGSVAYPHATQIALNGKTIWPSNRPIGPPEILSATWGPADIPNRAKDVTDQVRRKVSLDGTTFRVADLASEGDPALNIVKTLVVKYRSGGRIATVSATDPELIVLEAPAEPAPALQLETGVMGLKAVTTTGGAISTRLSSGKRGVTGTLAAVHAIPIVGPWNVTFSGPGFSGSSVFNKLSSWSENENNAIRFYSGIATYRKQFSAPAGVNSHSGRVLLDLGNVQVMAQVTLNGTLLGTLWKHPYRVDVTHSVQSGTNTLEIRVVNLLPNRMIGDESLAEDSDRNENGTLKTIPVWVANGRKSPTGRETFSTWRLWKKTDKLLPSGLMGPVILIQETLAPIK